MKAPGFWHGARNAAPARLLAPAAALYAAAVRWRMARTAPARAAGPVVCVGNATLGGAGKTPFAILVAERLRALGAAPHFLSRGYRGRLSGPVRVDPDRHGAEDVGDEPLLLARTAPVWVSRTRAAGADAAFKAGADVVVMDDGYQNPSLEKDFSILLVDTQTGFGNGRVFPAGPLREHRKAARARADAIVFVKPASDAPIPPTLAAFAEGRPSFACWLEPERAGEGEPVFAFCGIARPEKLFATLERAGFHIAGRRAFADHHRFTEREISRLRRDAEHAGARLVTTEKDFVRIRPDLRAGIEAFPVEMRTDAPERLDSILAALMAGRMDRTRHER